MQTSIIYNIFYNMCAIVQFYRMCYTSVVDSKAQ